MSLIVTNQNFLIYVLDADSKQLIRKNLLYNYGSIGEGTWGSRVMYGGTMCYDGGWGYEGISNITIDFVESHITALGYNYSSITGNEIQPAYDAELDTYLYPSVVVIYMSKL